MAIALQDTKAASKCRYRVASAIALCALVTGCSAFATKGTGEAVPIRRSEYLAVDGARLFLLTRGVDRRAPVLLWLHGGPGGAERPLFRYFNGGLENRFVVAYWDQRGAGRSFDPKADPHRLTVARHLADLDAVVDHLRRDLGREKIILIGHSWGAALGLLYVQAHPDKVSALIGVNPLVSLRAAEQAQYEFVLAEASRRNDGDVLARLRTIGPPPHKTVAQMSSMEALADRYGGAFYKDPHKMWVVLRGIFAGVVTPWEIPRLIRGIHVSLDAMNEELLELNLARSVPAADVPVFFFLGRHDRHADATLATAYLEALHAPVKRLIWFEDSAHNVPFEEPALFDAEIGSVLQSIGISEHGEGGLPGQPLRRGGCYNLGKRCAFTVSATGVEMSPSNKTAYLSKSLYMRGLQCHKSLYLDRHRPELRGEASPELEALFASGHQVGVYAHMLFPGGVVVPFDGLSKDEQLAKTRDEMDRGTKAIYEAAFFHDDVFVKADIVVRNRGYWDLHEVKSSTSVKEHYWDDVAIQYYVLAGCGVPVNKAYLVHINNSYVREGDIVPEELFVIQDITGVVRDKQASIPDTLAEMRAMLRGRMPKIDIGPHCEDPYECDFMPFCWQHVPEDSVFSLRGRGIDQWELYRQGVIRLEDVPLDSLNLMQRMQAEYFLDKKSHADTRKIREFLEKVRYPVCFVDFETFASPIPLFDGTRPYQQVPFQYSLHRIDADGEEPKHFEYLAQPGPDPRREIAEKLLGEIPEGACVVAYNMAFEKRVLRELGESLPGLRKRLKAVADGMIDLMELFKRRDIYHWRMNGSYSLKSVLPVLVPEMTYDGMEISDGAMASEAYFTMGEISDPAELVRLREALLEYCRQDTLGLVRLLEKMRSMAG